MDDGGVENEEDEEDGGVEVELHPENGFRKRGD